MSRVAKNPIALPEGIEVSLGDGEIAVVEQPRTPPVWQPEQASGTAWRSARDAASGARGAPSARPTPQSGPEPATESNPPRPSHP